MTLSRTPEHVAGLAERVCIGKCQIGSVGSSLRATLGSCAGLCIADPVLRRFALAHVLLPHAPERQLEPTARFADRVVPFILHELEIHRKDHKRLVAFVAGGARMYESGGQRHNVGELNASVLIQSLGAHGIHVARSDTGGTGGRQLVVDGPGGVVYSMNFDDEGALHTWELPQSFQRAAA